MTNRFGVGCACCNCLLFSDDFESGLDAGDWTEVSGTWSVSCPTTCNLGGTGAYAFIRMNQTAGGSMAVRATIFTGTNGRIIINAVDGDTYLAAEIDGTTLRLINRSGGTDTVAATLSPVSSSGTWEVSSNTTCFSASEVGGISSYLSAEHGGLPVGGIYAGFGTGSGAGSSATVQAMDFYKPNGAEEDCPAIVCGCNGCDVNKDDPGDLTYTFASYDPFACPSLTVESSYGLTYGGDCTWLYEVSPADNIVWKIAVDGSVSPPTTRVDYRCGSTDTYETGTLTGAAIDDCQSPTGNTFSTTGGIDTIP